MRVVFFCSSKFVIPIIEILKKNFDLALVVTTERLALQGETLQPPVIRYCTKHKIPYLSVQQFNNETIKQLKESNAPVAILADFGLIISNKVLNLFPKGILNIHPSLLPKYRGPTPVQAAILNGDKTTGVTIIKLDDEVDHGPILAQLRELISEKDTSESLYERLFRLGSSSIVRTIELYIKGKLTLRKQDHSKQTFTKRLSRQDGYIDLKSLEIRNLKLEIARKIRAYCPWPGAWTNVMINDKVLRIKFLPDKQLQIEGKKPVSYKDFINGYPEATKNLKFIIQN